ncbi:MAG: M20/M25/M40 family metallo-hydrolase, partial [Actinomycetota bacterium]|nr:M20/M25/M40 family metallo-hydrolase [Actinomycetota bacterium]
ARPATGRNAVHRLAPVLTAVAAYRGRRVVLDGCTYVEQLQAVAVDGGVAGNVVPDRATVTVNHRFAPDRTAEEAEAALRQLVAAQLEPGDEWVVEDAAAGAPPHLDDPLLARLVAITGRPPRAKVGWTDVATFAEHGVPATNFGPGDPELAHTVGEHVRRADLDRALAVLTALADEGPRGVPGGD